MSLVTTESEVRAIRLACARGELRFYDYNWSDFRRAKGIKTLEDERELYETRPVYEFHEFTVCCYKRIPLPRPVALALAGEIAFCMEHGLSHAEYETRKSLIPGLIREVQQAAFLERVKSVEGA
ncbi:hypothetical protein [Roseovarius sp. 217]|uniref:hypothetical protein n=1 Tax=Roseovarius sp. (strain 217) TaxID=314264 RepID=UPI0012ECF65E|nr:hypothetical protein [Roseovarius sp. 217]